MTNSDSLLTTSQVAERLGVSTHTAWRYLESGRVPSTKTPGGRYRVKEPDLAPFLGEHHRRRAEWSGDIEAPVSTEDFNRAASFLARQVAERDGRIAELERENAALRTVAK